MKENDFIQETTLFIEDLNKIFNISCNAIFDNECQYKCCLDPKTNSIIFNYNLINQDNDLELYLLGKDYLKYFILHEYGHIIYNEEIFTYVKQKTLSKNDSLQNFVIDYNCWLESKVKDNTTFVICMRNEHYWSKQYLAACEFLADYFVIKQIKKRYKFLNPNSFKLWRAISVLERYNHCHNNNDDHLEHLNYYHIPETMEYEHINFENDSLTSLIDLSLENSFKSLILAYSQSNVPEYYNTTNFGEKISSIIKKLKT